MKNKLVYAGGALLFSTLATLASAAPSGDMMDEPALQVLFALFPAAVFAFGLLGLPRKSVCAALFLPIVVAFFAQVRSSDDESGLWVIGLFMILAVTAVGFGAGELGHRVRRSRSR
jgi:hypothetical protein